jgi:phosphoribosylformylglycinamidine (FGAM) synthase-like enzyme
LGGSEYLYRLHGLIRGQAPTIDLDAERRLQRLLVDAAAEDLLLSAHDCSEGGIAVTLAECCFDTGGLGATAALGLQSSAFGNFADVLFSESASRVVVSTSPEDLESLMSRAASAGVPANVIGSTGGSRLVLRVGDAVAVDVPVAEAEAIWATALERYFEKTVA